MIRPVVIARSVVRRRAILGVAYVLDNDRVAVTRNPRQDGRIGFPVPIIGRALGEPPAQKYRESAQHGKKWLPHGLPDKERCNNDRKPAGDEQVCPSGLATDVVVEGARHPQRDCYRDHDHQGRRDKQCSALHSICPCHRHTVSFCTFVEGATTCKRSWKNRKTNWFLVACACAEADMQADNV